MEFYNNMNIVGKYICEYIFNSADGIIVLTEGWRKFVEKFVVNKEKIDIIGNFVSIPDLNINKNNSSNIKIIFLGRLGKRKGTYDLIDAAEILKLKGYNFKMILAGDGEIEKCKDIVNKRDLDNYISILGWVDDKRRGELLLKSDILVLPSYYESFGLSLIEGMSYKLPVVASLAGGIPEVVDNNIDGILIEPGDINELSKALEVLICNADIRKEFGENGYNHVIKEFSDKVALEKIISIYERVLEKK